MNSECFREQVASKCFREQVASKCFREQVASPEGTRSRFIGVRGGRVRSGRARGARLDWA